MKKTLNCKPHKKINTLRELKDEYEQWTVLSLRAISSTQPWDVLELIRMIKYDGVKSIEV